MLPYIDVVPPNPYIPFIKSFPKPLAVYLYSEPLDEVDIGLFAIVFPMTEFLTKLFSNLVFSLVEVYIRLSPFRYTVFCSYYEAFGPG